MIDDIFCKIINKEAHADVVMEKEDWIALKDIHPQAPVHVLIVPKKHIQDLSEATDTDAKLLGELLLAAEKIATQLKLKKGYRIIINKGEHGGQLVPHFHLHLLGGTKLGKKIIQDSKE
jgi:histidine triad (HIT) family protein